MSPNMTTKEMDELDLSEGVVDFSILCQKFGVRHVLLTFRQCDSAMYEELKAQINRGEQIPALLVKRV